MSTTPYRYHCFLSYTTREDDVRAMKPFLDAYIARLQALGVTFCPIFYDGWYLERRQYRDEELCMRLYEGVAMSAFTVAMLSLGILSLLGADSSGKSQRHITCFVTDGPMQYCPLPGKTSALIPRTFQAICQRLTSTPQAGIEIRSTNCGRRFVQLSLT